MYTCFSTCASVSLCKCLLEFLRKKLFSKSLILQGVCKIRFRTTLFPTLFPILYIIFLEIMVIWEGKCNSILRYVQIASQSSLRMLDKRTALKSLHNWKKKTWHTWNNFVFSLVFHLFIFLNLNHYIWISISKILFSMKFSQFLVDRNY